MTTILLAMLLLKERLNRVQLAGVLVSLVAIYLFNVQREDGFLSRWLMYALAPIVLWGASGFSMMSLLFSVVGGIAGIWAGVRISGQLS